MNCLQRARARVYWLSCETATIETSQWTTRKVKIERRARTRFESSRAEPGRSVPGGFVFLGVHHGIEFALVRHANLHEPTVRESGFVHRARGIRQALVDFDDFARDGRVDVGRRFYGFHDTEGGRFLNLAANFRKFDVHNVTQFRLFSRRQRYRGTNNVSQPALDGAFSIRPLQATRERPSRVAQKKPPARVSRPPPL